MDSQQTDGGDDKLIGRKWSVVHFLATNTVSLVPNNWINELEDGVRCYWPEGDKDVSKKIKKFYPPDIAWDFPEIRVLKEFDKYDEGKQAEKRLEYSEFTDIESERPLGRGQRKQKKKRDSSFIKDIPSPPKIQCLSQYNESMPVAEVNNSNEIEENGTRANYFVSQPEGFLIEAEPAMNDRDADSTRHNTSTITLGLMSPSVSFGEGGSQIYAAIMEVRELVKEIKECIKNQNISTTTVTSFDTIPKEPFKKYNKLIKYEQILQDEETNQQQLETMLFLIGGSSVVDMIKRGLKRLFSNKLATKCSWLGRNHKYPVHKLTSVRILKAAVRKRFSNLSDFVFEETIKLWLRQASLRYNRECAKVQN